MTHRKTRRLLLSLIMILALLVAFGCMPEDAEKVSEDVAVALDEFASFLDTKLPPDFSAGFSRGFIVQLESSTPLLSYSGFKAEKVEPVLRLKSAHAFRTMLTPEELKELLDDPSVVWVSPDREIHTSVFEGSPGLLLQTTGADQVVFPKDYRGGFEGITGKGIGIAVLDSGINLFHKDLARRIIRAVDFTGENDIVQDDYGHGTHVAGLIAGIGKESFDGQYAHYLAGIAPGAFIYNLKVLGENGTGRLSDVIAAIDWVIEKHQIENIRVINLSLGVPPMASHLRDPLAVACAMAVKEGIVVVASAGNFGNYDGKTLYGTITSPGFSPYVITVGAADTKDTAVRSDDSVAAFSSRGPTLYDGFPKPDLIAPGTGLKAAMSDGGLIAELNPTVEVDPCEEDAERCEKQDAQYIYLSGTSMAAPVVSGTVALMLEANPSLTPNAVKAILMASAQSLPDVPYIEQGEGLLNVEGAVRLADSIGDLDQMSIGEEWIIGEGDLLPVSMIAGEEVAWSQGIGWTGYTSTGFSVFTVYQPAYSIDSIWGMGIGWTGITYSFDPVYFEAIKIIWASNLVDPMSLPLAGMGVLVSQHIDWMGSPEYLEESNPAFPQAK